MVTNTVISTSGTSLLYKYNLSLLIKKKESIHINIKSIDEVSFISLVFSTITPEWENAKERTYHNQMQSQASILFLPPVQRAYTQQKRISR